MPAIPIYFISGGKVITKVEVELPWEIEKLREYATASPGRLLVVDYGDVLKAAYQPSTLEDYSKVRRIYIIIPSH